MDDAQVIAALRLGWAMAESRGRSWPQGPGPSKGTELPPPEDLQLLPLRYQREAETSRRGAVATLLAQLGLLGFSGGDALGKALLSGQETIGAEEWPAMASSYKEADSSIQDRLSTEADALANAYLLGRGLGECFWGLGPDTQWSHENEPSGVSLLFLFGEDRRRELTRMLGRLDAPGVHALSPSAISGSLEAWGAVAASELWRKGDPEFLRVRLYEQVRRWYQLLVLGQDPTTMVKPSAQLGSWYYLRRTLLAFLPQVVLAGVAVLLTSTFFLTLTADFLVKVKPLLATGGVSAFAIAGLMAKGQSAAQQMGVRRRQDAYTDLVCFSITAVPKCPPLDWRPEATPPAPTPWRDEVGIESDRAWRRADRLVEEAVRRRRLTPPTPPAAT